jgi:hypothetical protein
MVTIITSSCCWLVPIGWRLFRWQCKWISGWIAWLYRRAKKRFIHFVRTHLNVFRKKNVVVSFSRYTTLHSVTLFISWLNGDVCNSYLNARLCSVEFIYEVIILLVSCVFHAFSRLLVSWWLRQSASMESFFLHRVQVILDKFDSIFTGIVRI